MSDDDDDLDDSGSIENVQDPLVKLAPAPAPAPEKPRPIKPASAPAPDLPMIVSPTSFANALDSFIDHESGHKSKETTPMHEEAKKGPPPLTVTQPKRRATSPPQDPIMTVNPSELMAPPIDALPSRPRRAARGLDRGRAAAAK